MCSIWPGVQNYNPLQKSGQLQADDWIEASRSDKQEARYVPPEQRRTSPVIQASLHATGAQMKGFIVAIMYFRHSAM